MTMSISLKMVAAIALLITWHFLLCLEWVSCINFMLLVKLIIHWLIFHFSLKWERRQVWDSLSQESLKRVEFIIKFSGRTTRLKKPKWISELRRKCRHCRNSHHYFIAGCSSICHILCFARLLLSWSPISTAEILDGRYVLKYPQIDFPKHTYRHTHACTWLFISTCFQIKIPYIIPNMWTWSIHWFWKLKSRPSFFFYFHGS